MEDPNATDTTKQSEAKDSTYNACNTKKREDTIRILKKMADITDVEDDMSTEEMVKTLTARAYLEGCIDGWGNRNLDFISQQADEIMG